jgi:hypothetical protein
MSDLDPVQFNGPAGPAEVTGRRLFVHEYRCMAAPANGAGTGKCVIKNGRQRRRLRE